MDNSKQLLHEIRKILHTIIYVSSLLNAAIIFLFLYLLCELTNISKIIPILLTFIYMAAHVMIKLNRTSFKSVEDKFPFMKEKLRTVADTLKENNPVVDSLRKDVLSMSRNIMTSSFVNTKDIGTKLGFIVILSFLIMFVSLQDVRIFDAKAYLEENPFFRLKELSLEGQTEVDIGQEMVTSSAGGSGQSEDIFGDESLAVLGKKEVDLKIKLVPDQIDLRDIQDTEKKEFNEDTFPSEMYTKSDASFQSTISREQQELVKDYFSKLSEKGE